MWIADANQMRGLEASVLRDLGMPGLLWMERAAAAIVREACSPPFDTRKIVILCGPGNNGGDGFAAARILHLRGASVSVALATEAARLHGDALINFEVMSRAGVPVLRDNDVAGSLTDATLVIDALLGTGATGAPRGRIGEWIREANSARSERGASWQCIAVDIPSGLDASTGSAAGEVIAASTTVTFGMPKWGHFLGAAPNYVGRLVTEPLDIARAAASELMPPLGFVYDGAHAREDFVPSLPAAHKNSRGHVLLVGGADATAGAIALAADAALHAGAGVATVAGSERARSVALTHRAELMTRDIAGLTAASLDAYDAFVVGPGLRPDADGAAALNTVLAAAGSRPVILDAGALQLVADQAAGALPEGTVLTPHPGELARLAGVSSADAVADLRGIAAAVAARHRAVVVAKTAGALVVAQRHAFVPPGSPLMATAGCGDVLAGTIGGLAPRHGATAAARLGSWVHAEAGRAAASLPATGALVASDIIRHLGAVLHTLQS